MPKRRKKPMRNNKYRNEKTWHGRPSKQGRQRVRQLRTAPGASVAIASS